MQGLVGVDGAVGRGRYAIPREIVRILESAVKELIERVVYLRGCFGDEIGYFLEGHHGGLVMCCSEAASPMDDESGGMKLVKLKLELVR